MSKPPSIVYGQRRRNAVRRHEIRFFGTVAGNQIKVDRADGGLEAALKKLHTPASDGTKPPRLWKRIS